LVTIKDLQGSINLPLQKYQIISFSFLWDIEKLTIVWWRKCFEYDVEIYNRGHQFLNDFVLYWLAHLSCLKMLHLFVEMSCYKGNLQTFTLSFSHMKFLQTSSTRRWRTFFLKCWIGKWEDFWDDFGLLQEYNQIWHSFFITIRFILLLQFKRCFKCCELSWTCWSRSIFFILFVITRKKIEIIKSNISKHIIQLFIQLTHFICFSHCCCCFLSYFEGLLTVVPCSPIAGLEILDHETQTWISVENELNLTPFRDLVVFPGRTLQILTNDHYIGTTHRVGKNNQPRLSLVYELRTKADLNLDTFLINLQQQ
jgi:hypothetical protein